MLMIPVEVRSITLERSLRIISYCVSHLFWLYEEFWMRNYAAIHCGYSLVLVCSAEFILQQQLTKLEKKYENNNNLIVLISIDELF